MGRARPLTSLTMVRAGPGQVGQAAPIDISRFSPRVWRFWSPYARARECADETTRDIHFHLSLKGGHSGGEQNVRFVYRRLGTSDERTRLLLLRRPGPCWLEGRAISKVRAA